MLAQGMSLKSFIASSAFAVCGDVVRVRLPRGKDGLPKGTAARFGEGFLKT